MKQNLSPPRLLSECELRLIEYLLRMCQLPFKLDLPISQTFVAELLDDGGMGSMQFLHECRHKRLYGKPLIEVTPFDTDGRKVFLELSVDEDDYLYELDSFTTDFKALKAPLGTTFVFEDIFIYE